MKKEHDLRLVFWNVRNMGDDEHVKDETDRVQAIADLIVNEDVDVACIAEVVGEDIKTKMNDVLPPGYTIHQTTSENFHGIMTIFKNAANRKTVIQQRNEFKGPKGKDRAYPLIEITQNDQKIAILPMHAKAGSRDFDFNLRQHRLQDVSNLAVSLHEKQVPLIALGDMNTVGKKEKVDAQSELRRAEYLLYDPATEFAYEDWDAAKMILLPKDSPNSWKGIGKDSKFDESDMDHVFVSEWFADNIKEIDGNADGAKVKVGGWTEQASEEARKQWVKENSDHGYIMLDIDMSPKKRPAP